MLIIKENSTGIVITYNPAKKNWNWGKKKIRGESISK